MQTLWQRKTGFLVSVLYKCRSFREEAGDDKCLLYGSATDCIDAEAVLEVHHPKEEGLASHFHTNCLFQPAFSPFSLSFLSLFPSIQKRVWDKDLLENFCELLLEYFLSPGERLKFLCTVPLTRTLYGFPKPRRISLSLLLGKVSRFCNQVISNYLINRFVLSFST